MSPVLIPLSHNISRAYFFGGGIRAPLMPPSLEFHAHVKLGAVVAEPGAWATHQIYQFWSLLCVYLNADRCFNSLIETRKAEKDKIGLSRTDQERIVRTHSGNDYISMATGFYIQCGSEAHNKRLLNWSPQSLQTKIPFRIEVGDQV